LARDADHGRRNILTIAVGFIFSFIFGWIVVKSFLRYIQRHTFALFAWWRIVVGTAGIYAIYFM
jgi:undecaprenyl-diphosphatase